MPKGDEVARGKIRDNLKSCHLVTHSLAMIKKIQMMIEHFSNNDQFFLETIIFFQLLDQWWRLNHHPLED